MREEDSGHLLVIMWQQFHLQPHSYTETPYYAKLDLILRLIGIKLLISKASSTIFSLDFIDQSNLTLEFY